MAERLHEIDGLRGWAAVSVMVFHLLQQTFGTIYPNICPPHLWFFMDGPMSVYIFLILSGDALSSSHVMNPISHKLDYIIAKRYLRLTIPVLLTVLATCFIMKAGWVFNQQAAVLVSRQDWLGAFLTFPASLQSAINYSLTLVISPHGPDNWNTLLWTIPVEMYGSLLVFSYMHIIPRLRRPMLTTLGLIVILAGLTEYYALFFIGVLMAQARASGLFLRVRAQHVGLIASTALLASAYAVEWASHCYSTPPPSAPGFTLGTLRFVLNHRQHILAVMIVVGCYTSTPMLWFLRSASSRLMGRLSFAMYLVQFPILCSFESWLILRYNAHLGSIGWVLAIAGLSIAVTMMAAELMSRLDNLLLTQVSRGLARLFVTNSSPTVQAASPLATPETAGV